MSSIDERIVQMQFNNSQFEKGIKESLKSLDALKEGLDLEGSAKQLKALQKAGDSFSLAKMAEGIESVSKRFSTLGIVGMRVIDNLANSAYYNGKRLISSLSIDQVTAGWTKYGQKTASVQTIMNATGKSIDEVNGYLDKLMWFSDETSYGFTDMTQALGQLTSAGGDIERLIPMIEGIANATAFAGKGTGEFSRAMYNLNQSYSAGYLQYMDWKSLELAGIASKQLKEQLIEAGKATGKLNKDGKTAKGTLVTVSNLGQTLNEKWADTEVMEKAFGKFAEMTEKAYELVQEGKFDTASDAYAYLATQYDDISITAAKAAQEAKTFTEALDATKDAVSSSWMKTFELIFGNYDQAKVMWTDLANYLWDIFASGGEARNEMLQEWQELGGRDSLLAGVYDMFEALKNVIDAVKAAIAQVIPPMTAEKLVEISNAVKDFGASLKTLTEIRTEIIKKPSEADDEIDILGGFIPGQTKKVKADLEELERTINRGMRGDDVKKLQERLKQLGYDIGETGVDGIYGPKTQAALKKFQEDYGLAIDGIYGKLSHAKMSEALGIGDETESKKIRVAGKEITIYSDTLKKIQSIVRGVTSVFSLFGQVLGFAFNIIKVGLNVLSPLGDMLFTIAAAFGDWLYGLNKSIQESGVFATAIEKIKNALAPVKNFFEGVKDSVLNFFGIGDKADKSVNKLSKFQEIFQNLKSKIISSGVIEKFSESFGELKNSIKSVIPSIKNFYNKVKGYFGEKLSKAGSWFIEKIPVAIEAISNFFAGAVDWISPYISKIPEYAAKVKDFFIDIYDSVKKNETVKMILNGIGTGFANFWNQIKGFFGKGETPKFVTSIKNFFSGIYDQLSENENLKSKFEALKSTFESIKNWVVETWDKLKEAVSGFFGTNVDETAPVQDQIKERFSAFEEFGDWMSATWERIKEKFGTMFENIKTNFERFKNLNWGLIGTIGGVAVVLALIVKLINWVRGILADLVALKGRGRDDKKETVSFADNFRKIALSIAIVAASIIALGSMDPNKLDQGLKYIAIVFGAISAVIVLSAIFLKGDAGESVEKAGNAFMRIGIGIGIIAAAIVAIGWFYTKNKKGFVAGAIAVGVIMLAMSLMVIAISRFGGDGGNLKIEVAMKGLIKLAIAIGILAFVVKRIGSMELFELAQGLGGLLAICAILKLILKEVGRTGTVKIAGMIGLATAVAMLAYSASELGKLPLEQLAKGVGALVVILLALSFFMKTLNNSAGNPQTIASSVVILTALGIFMYAFSEIVKGMKGTDANLVIALAGGIAAMLVAVAVALALIDKSSSGFKDTAKNAAKLGLATGIVTLIAGSVLALIGALDDLTGGWISSKIESGAKVLIAIGNALSSMGGAFQTISGGSTILGTGLAVFDKIMNARNGTNGNTAGQSFLNTLAIQAAFWSVSLIAGAIIEGIGYLDDISEGDLKANVERGAAVLQDVGDALEVFNGPLGVLTGGLSGLGLLISFIKGDAGTKILLGGWVNTVILTDILATVPTIVTALLAGLGELDKIGNGDVGRLQDDIRKGGEVLQDVGDALEAFNGPLGIITLAISGLGSAIGLLGTSGTGVLLTGWLNTAIITGIFSTVAGIGAACTAGLGVWDRKNNGQLVADIQRGGDVLNSVGGALANLASGFKTEAAQGVADSLKIISEAEFDDATIDKALENAENIQTFLDKWTGVGSFGDWFKNKFLGVGFVKQDKTRTLTSNMTGFSSAIKTVAADLSQITEQDISNIQIGIDGATKVAEFFDLLASDEFNNLQANNGPWRKFWFGDTETTSFIDNLSSLGTKMSEFAGSVAKFSEGSTKDDLDVAIEALKNVAEVGILTGDTRFDPGVLDVVTSSIGTFARSFGKASESMKEDEVDTAFVTDFANAVSKIGSAVATFNGSDTESFKSKMEALKGVFSGSMTVQTDVLSGVTGDTTTIMRVCNEGIRLIRGYRKAYENAGSYMAAGLAQGIKQAAPSAKIAAAELARKALSTTKITLEERSPSKKTAEFGRYFSEGFANGITEYSSAAVVASKSVAKDALNTVRASLSGMSGLLDSETTSDPVIRPIVDLTNVGDGARAIRSMLSGDSTISVGANVDNARAAASSISKANANQNGSGTGNIDNSNVSSNSVNVSGNFYVRSDQDIHSLASEIAALGYQQKRALGGHA